ncbi:NAD(P)-binding protein [Calocera cornea HHB12733]|uniref:NAD(P)-binding protein n=1 Tax=Calocera cornea HHB12733 TaxID=1353952 RepID=A0A165CW27_9BASI|nr:NAD(P)-binding protein [Calocera cornea HHB12733]
MAPKVWLITGASSGFGRIMTELVLENGDICIATSIDPPALADLVPKYTEGRLLILEMDVTKFQDVVLAFKTAEQAYGYVDVVFNNAGVAIAGDVEVTPEDKARKLFDINFWGSANVTKETIRFFREVNGPERGGKLLQMTSMLGIGGWGSLGYYTASKHAVEGLTKSLAEELKPEWNIQIMLIEPGFMRTAMLTGVERFDPLPAYAAGVGAKTAQEQQARYMTGDPQRAMESVHHVAQMDKLPIHLPIGPGAIKLFKYTIDELTKAVEDCQSVAK